jgi:type IV pilus assembly protein PilM
MAHTITGIDVGSRSIKFAVFDAGFRRTRINTTFEEPVPPGEAPLAERQAEALRAGVARLPSESTITMAFPGEMLTMRVLDLPFADARKVEQVVGYELEGQIMHDLSEVVMDHIVLSAPSTQSETAGSRALAIAARTEAIAGFLASLKQSGVEPRTLYVAPIIYHALLAEEPAEETPAACRLFIDMGHLRSQLCFLRGNEAVFGRTSSHAGEELTAALARASAGKWTFEQAEQAKHAYGFVPSHARPPATSAQQQLGPILRDALAPFLRDLRQTLASFRAQDKTPVEAILLAGGSSRLQGLAEFLQEELGIPTSLWPAPPKPAESPEGDSEADGSVEVSVVDEEGSASRARMALAFALAWAGVRGRRELDLRRGPFQYKVSLSVMRQKASHLALLAAALLACAAVDGTIALRRLSGEQQQLREKLKVATKELFGEARSDATEVTAALRQSFRDEMAPLPRVTAYDLLDQISRKMPPAEQVAIDVQDMEIKAKKTSIKGTVDSAASLDDIVAKLKEIDCFEEINKGPLTEISSGEKQFSLTINSKCP